MYLIFYTLSGEACYSKADDAFDAVILIENLKAKGAKDICAMKRDDIDDIGD